jgi:hypothetical protein
VEEAQKAAVQKAQQEAARCRFCGGLWEKIMEKMGKTRENHGGNMGKSSKKWSFSWENLLGMEVISNFRNLTWRSLPHVRGYTPQIWLYIVQWLHFRILEFTLI